MAQLDSLLRRAPLAMEALRAARAVGAPDWLVAAGAIRDAVWDLLHDREPAVPRDVDLAYFAVDGLTDDAVEAALRERAPAIPWEARNQAIVHEWYPQRFGIPVPPFTSSADAIATFPEVASSVGVRLLPDDSLHVIAPYGLEDLLGCVCRHNPARVPPEYYEERVAAHGWRERWPRMTYEPARPTSRRRRARRASPGWRRSPPGSPAGWPPGCRGPAERAVSCSSATGSARSEGVEEVREIVRGLRPQALDEFGLRSALISLADGVTERTGVRVRARLAPDLPPFAPEQDLAIYRVAQESLTNVARHAGAETASLSLSVVAGSVVLAVRDDGRGISDVEAAGPGTGLAGMRERALLVGGRLFVRRHDEGGTEATLVVPLDS